MNFKLGKIFGIKSTIPVSILRLLLILQMEITLIQQQQNCVVLKMFNINRSLTHRLYEYC